MSGIFSNIVQFIQSFVQQLQNISPWVCLAVVAVAGLIYTFGDQEASESAKRYGKKVVIGLFCVWFASLIINTLIELFGAGVSPLG